MEPGAHDANANRPEGEPTTRPASPRARQVARVALRGALLLAGVASFSIAIRGLIAPNHLLSGGVTGAALLFNNLLGVPVGLTVVALNVPIFVLGFRDAGRAFAILSAASVVGFWLLVDFVPIEPLTDDPLLAAVFGGVLGGIGSSLTLRAGGSLGGFDILGVVVNRRFSLGLGEVLLALNGVLVIAAGFTSTAELAMYTLVGIFTTGWTVDALQAPRPRKAFLIVASRPEPIRERVLRQMHRGVTIIPVMGGYAGEDRTALLCVVTRPELRELADIVQAEDPDAFVVVLEAGEVMGRFRGYSRRAAMRRLGQTLRPRDSDAS